MSSYQQPPPRRAAWFVPAALATALLAAGGTTFLLLTGGDDPESAAAGTDPTTAIPAAPPPVATPAGRITTESGPDDGNAVDISCFLASNVGPRKEFTIEADRNGRHDFSAAWDAEGYFCDVIAVGGSPQEIVTPGSDREETALRASGYADDDISSLFAICADVNPAEDYLKPGYEMTLEQSDELIGALVLCPGQPLSQKWRQLIQREASPDGGTVGDGLHRVGQLVKPGTYTATEEDGCFWERQSSTGKALESRYVQPGARATVTVRSGDAAFLSAGCGDWKRG